jgi:hypothetical protein
MLAARLAGITYSVQARAHDIHRNAYRARRQILRRPNSLSPTLAITAYMKTFLSAPITTADCHLNNHLAFDLARPPQPNLRRHTGGGTISV